MSRTRTSRIARALASLCALVLLLAGWGSLASVLTFALHDGEHAHNVSLVAAAGHLHVVLSHDEDHESHAEAAAHVGHHAVDAAGSHVLDLDSGEILRANGRGVPTGLLATMPTAAAPGLLGSAAGARSDSRLAPYARSRDFSRTVVLRL